MPGETVTKTIERTREQRKKFEAFCRSLSEEELSRPVPDSTWIVKDFVSHLGSLDPTLTQLFKVTVAGRPEEAAITADGSRFNLDALNDGLVAERREWPVERILQEAATNRVGLIAALEAMSEEDVSRVMHFQGDNKRSPAQLPLKVFLMGWSMHDAIHAADMLKALPERASDAEITAWVEHPVIKGYQAAMAGPARR
jgi:hypothetical protein